LEKDNNLLPIRTLTYNTGSTHTESRVKTNTGQHREETLAKTTRRQKERGG
jgi:hypothetical protein